MNLPLTYERVQRGFTGGTDLCEYCGNDAVCMKSPELMDWCPECEEKGAHICPGPCQSGTVVFGNNQLCGECQHEIIELHTQEQ